MHVFEERKASFRQQATATEKRLHLLSALRTGIFVASIALIVYFANLRMGVSLAITAAMGLIAFFWLVSSYGKAKERFDYLKALATANEEELARLAHRWHELPTPNIELPDTSHPYIYDLDIFGKASLFSLLNRAGTRIGQQRLASWLIEASGNVLERQQAAQELAPQLDWRQQWQATAFIKQEAQPAEKLLQWMAKEPQNNDSQSIRIASFIGPLMAIIALIGIFAFDWPLFSLLLGAGGNAWVVAKLGKAIGEALEQLSAQERSLRQYAKLMALAEGMRFESPFLKACQNDFTKSQASAQIAKLSHILYHLERRQNAWFYALLGFWVLYDVRHYWRLLEWKRQHREALPSWLHALSELEAIVSIAGFAHLYPHYAYPTIAEERFVLEANNLGHPLIHESKRVSNNFSLHGQGHTAIITGANMSGKSTFERTVGINAVLAFAGAPVCAQSLRISRFQLFTSMRTQDSLEANVSGFYAELKRLKSLLDLLEGEADVLFFLDEVLKGTNSIDRHKGAEAIIELLQGKKAMGLISTHDLGLGELAQRWPKQVSNYSFNSAIIEGKLHFDHQISEGVCHSFSAIALMQGIGLPIVS